MHLARREVAHVMLFKHILGEHNDKLKSTETMKVLAAAVSSSRKAKKLVMKASLAANESAKQREKAEEIMGITNRGNYTAATNPYVVEKEVAGVTPAGTVSLLKKKVKLITRMIHHRKGGVAVKGAQAGVVAKAGKRAQANVRDVVAKPAQTSVVDATAVSTGAATNTP